MLQCNDYVNLSNTCCNAHMKLRPIGLLVAIVTPSQMIVTTAATALHIASLQSHHGRVPPAIGTPMLCVPASLKVCSTVHSQKPRWQWTEVRIGPHGITALTVRPLWGSDLAPHGLWRARAGVRIAAAHCIACKIAASARLTSL
jgi:hypothetical protein